MSQLAKMKEERAGSDRGIVTEQKSCQGRSYWRGGPGVDRAPRDGGPQSKLLCVPSGIFMLGVGKKSGLI